MLLVSGVPLAKVSIATWATYAHTGCQTACLIKSKACLHVLAEIIIDNSVNIELNNQTWQGHKVKVKVKDMHDKPSCALAA